MSFADILPLLFTLAAVVLVLYLCYLFSKFMANKVNNVSKFNNIKIIERVALTHDKGLVIIDVGGKYYLVGFASNGIKILKELAEADLHIPHAPSKKNFLEVLNATIKSRLDMKKSDDNEPNNNRAEDFQNGENNEEKEK